MSDKLLSIIVPAYNMEKYIRSCLDSLCIEEMIDQVEVIVVNDGSKDMTLEIAKEYKKKYPHYFEIIDKENGGHGSAWNMGIKEARGKYLKFLDSDDWFENFSDYLDRLKDTDADLVLTPIVHYYQDQNIRRIITIPNIIEGKEYDASTYNWMSMPEIYNTDFWYATYKTDLIKNYYPLFVEHVSYDDAILFISPIVWSHSLVYYDIPLYVYRLGREGQSVAINTQKKKALDYVRVSYSLVDFASNSIERVSYNKSIRVKYITNFYIRICFKYFKLLPYKSFKDNIPSWYQNISSSFPYVSRTIEMKWLEKYPFIIFWILMKSRVVIQKLQGYSVELRERAFRFIRRGNERT